MLKRLGVILVAFGITVASLSRGWDRFVRRAYGLMLMMGGRRFACSVWCVMFTDRREYLQHFSCPVFVSTTRDEAARFVRAMMDKYSYFFHDTLKIEAMWTFGKRATSQAYSPELDDFREHLMSTFYILYSYGELDNIYDCVRRYWYDYLESKCA